MDLNDRPAADQLLSSRHDVMTVYRQFAANGASEKLFPLRYVRSGFQSKLPTIMIVPGGPGIASVFPYELLRRDMASRGLDVVMMEHRGVGMSRGDAKGQDLPREVMKIDYVLEDMRAVLDHARIEKVVLYGSGYGAYLTQRFALKYPQRVESLILDSPHTSVADEKAFQQALRSYYWDGTFERTESIAAAVRKIVADQIVPAEETGPVLAAVHEYGSVAAVRDLVDLLVMGRGQLAWTSIYQILMGREWFNATPFVFENDLVGAISVTELGFGSSADAAPVDPLALAKGRTRGFEEYQGQGFDLEKERSNIEHPTLILSGSRDLVVPNWRSQLAAESIPNARLMVVPNTGHSILDSHVELAAIASHWVAAGAIDQLITKDVSRLRKSVVNEAFGRGINAALLAEKYSPLKLWSARSLMRGPLAAADARGPNA